MIADAETNKFWIAARKYNLAEKLKEYPTLILQGELYGQGIQKNKLGIEGVDLAVFNIEDREHRRRLGLTEMLGLATILNLNLVPIICIIEDFNWTFDDLQKYADCQKYANGEAAEGIVIRPAEPFMSAILRDWFSVKVINREYHL
jgi:ATP-dependent RNA circularization protein (DNA/RNA ligase family)